MRYHDRTFHERDIEFKLDNFAKHRPADELVHLQSEVNKDIALYKEGLRTPHWHSMTDPRTSVDPEVRAMFEQLNAEGIRWTWGRRTPSVEELTPFKPKAS